MVKKLISFILLLAIVCIYFVPDETDYLERIAQDYALTHAGEEISPAALKQMLNYQYDHHLFFSKFTLQYGGLTVEYHGFLSMVFFSESNDKSEASEVLV